MGVDLLDLSKASTPFYHHGQIGSDTHFRQPHSETRRLPFSHSMVDVDAFSSWLLLELSQHDAEDEALVDYIAGIIQGMNKTLKAAVKVSRSQPTAYRTLP
jgi:hypothetical protein